MFWWRGKGLILFLLLAAIIVAAGKSLGNRWGMPAGLSIAAALAFMLKDWAGEEASVFSVPVKAWPYLFIGCAGLIAITG